MVSHGVLYSAGLSIGRSGIYIYSTAAPLELPCRTAASEKSPMQASPPTTIHPTALSRGGGGGKSSHWSKCGEC